MNIRYLNSKDIMIRRKKI